MAVCSGCAQRLLEGNPFSTLKSILEELVRSFLDPISDTGFRRTTVGRVVLEAAVIRRIMRWRDDDSVGESSFSPAVVGENRMRYRGCRRVFIVFSDHHFDAVGCQHLERTRKRGGRKRVSVHPKK